jgi:hypothetical protein
MSDVFLVRDKLHLGTLFPKIKGMKKTLLWLLPVLAVALLGFYAFFLHPGTFPVNPAILIGLDGADWNIIHPLF